MPSVVNPAGPIVPRPPASETAAASADRPTAAIPAEIIGYSMPNISEILVCSMTDRLPCLPPGICVSSHGLSYQPPPDPDFRCGFADSELTCITVTESTRHYVLIRQSP